MTELGLLKLIIKFNSHTHVPLLLLTAYSDNYSLLEAIRAGFEDYLTKPFTPK